MTTSDARQAPRARLVPESVATRARMLVRAPGGRPLTERESKVILALYGIRVTREILAPNFEDAVKAAEQIGYPVVAKAESPELLHKSDAGAVMLNITDEVGLKRGFKRTLASAWATVPWDSIHGILVQEMIAHGTEIVVRMTNEPPQGVIITCGLGEVVVDASRAGDVILPLLTDADARAAVADVLVRFSELCRDLRDDVREIDINPLIVAEAGGGACAVDCLIVPMR